MTSQSDLSTNPSTADQAMLCFLRYYELSRDGFVDDPYELEGTNEFFTGRIRRLRLKKSGRFGNTVRALLHATSLARAFGVDQIEAFPFELGPTEPIIRAQEITFSFGPFPGPAEPTLAGSFFNTFAFEGTIQTAQPEFALETIDLYLRPLFYQHLVAANSCGPDAIVLNFRSGDIFDEPPASMWYVQPPASFYITALETARHQFGVSRAILVAEDRRNPAVAAIEKYLSTHGIPFQDRSDGPEQDLRTLLGTAHIAAPFSTFTESAAILSRNLAGYFAFRAIEAHARQHPRRVEPLLASVLRIRDVRAFVISDQDRGYIAPESWRNTPEQRCLMTTYPSEGLSVQEILSPELTGDKRWLNEANDEVLRLRSALRAARDEEVRLHCELEKLRCALRAARDEAVRLHYELEKLRCALRAARDEEARLHCELDKLRRASVLRRLTVPVRVARRVMRRFWA